MIDPESIATFDPSIDPNQAAHYRDDLDALVARGCTQCGGSHGPMEMTAACHGTDKLHVTYWSGVVFIKCSVCERLVVSLAIKEKPAQQEQDNADQD